MSKLVRLSISVEKSIFGIIYSKEGFLIQDNLKCQEKQLTFYL